MKSLQSSRKKVIGLIILIFLLSLIAITLIFLLNRNDTKTPITTNSQNKEDELVANEGDKDNEIDKVEIESAINKQYPEIYNEYVLKRDPFEAMQLVEGEDKVYSIYGLIDEINDKVDYLCAEYNLSTGEIERLEENRISLNKIDPWNYSFSANPCSVH